MFSRFFSGAQNFSVFLVIVFVYIVGKAKREVTAITRGFRIAASFITGWLNFILTT